MTREDLLAALPPACEPRGTQDMDVCGVHGELLFDGRCEDWDRGVRDAVLRFAAALPDEGLHVELLREAIYAVSVRHDWANTVDTTDRTEEIAAEYAALARVPVR